MDEIIPEYTCYLAAGPSPSIAPVPILFTGLPCRSLDGAAAEILAAGCRRQAPWLSPPGRFLALPPAIPAAPTPPAAGRSEDPTTPDPVTTQRRRSPVPATTPMLNLAQRSTWPMLTRAQVPVGLPKAPCIPVCRRVLACVLGHGTSAAEGASPEHMHWGVDQKEPMETLKHRVSMVNNPCDMRVQVRSRRWIPLAWTVCWQGRETSRAAGAGAAAPSIDRR